MSTLINLSKAFTFTNPPKEEEYLRKALEVAKGVEDLEMKVYYLLAYNLYRVHQLDSTLAMSQKLLTYCQENEGKCLNTTIADCYANMGHVMLKRNELEAATDFYKKGLKVASPLSLAKSALYLSLGNVQELLGKEKEALESCFSALAIAEELKDNRLIGGVKDKIGSLYSNRKDYQKAIIYYSEAITASSTANISIAVAVSKINLASTYLALGKKETSLKLYEEVLAFSEKINYAPFILYSKAYLANFYAQDNSSKCEPLLIELGTLVEQMDAAPLLQYYNAKAYYHKNRKEYQLAIEIADSLRQFSVTYKEKDMEANSVLLLAELHHQNGTYQQAYDYQVEYKMLSDSLVNQQRLANIKIREAKYNFEKEQLSREKVYQAESAAQKRFNIWTTLFVVVLGIISFFLFRVAQSRKKLSSELLEKNKYLAMVNESKTRFFANFSHELKTPLTLIINPLQKLRKQKIFAEDNLYLIKTAEKNSLELFNLTNQILELTKFEVDKVETNYTNLNFPYLIKKTFANFEPLAQSRGIDFELAYQGNDELTIQTDEYKLQTILKNLISNALKFTVADDLVKIKVIEKETVLNIEVHDTGRGIHQQDLANVFDRYFQAKIPKAVSEGGTGIGLAICKEYTKLLGGDISVTSKYGESTTFSVSFPKVIAKDTITVARPILPIQDRLNRKKSAPISSDNDLPTLLLIEDNLEMQEYIQFTLQTYFNIIIAGNGDEGLQTLSANAPQIQLIISDIMMPIKDGYEFLEAVKKDERFASIPIIMLTALSDAKHKLKGLRIGIDSYLIKPFVEEELIIGIERLIANAAEKKAFQLTLKSAVIPPAPANREEVTKQFISQASEKISIQDLEWLKHLETIVKENISDTSYTVDKLATQMTMSRSLVYRKIKALTGLTPNNYINQARYEQARYYLETKKVANIKAVAYKVGFKDEKYFARNFKKRFGKYPSEFLK